MISSFDDMFAKGLREAIGGDDTLRVVAAGVEQSRIDVVLRAHGPDVAILDADAIASPLAVRDLGVRHPKTRLVLFARDPSIAVCAPMLAFGASACLGRDTQSRDVLNAIHLASRGLQLAPRALSPPSAGAGSPAQTLTRREAEVLLALQAGRSNAEIALALQIGVETVRTHVHHIFGKLGVGSRAELARGPAAVESAPVQAHRPRAATRQSPWRRGHGMRAR